jgi:hypothetical protein
VLNIAAALKFYEWNTWGISELYWSLLILSVTGIIIIRLFRWYRDQAFIAVGVWAFWALTLRHWESLPILAYFSLGIMISFILLIIIQLVRPTEMVPD